jgi:cytosine/adenosine deaminase-related metal-dependent hydrolase
MERIWVDLILEHGLVLTMDSQDRMIENGAVAILGDSIIAVGPQEEIVEKYQARKTISAERKVIMPGLVDTYGHAGHGMIKGIHHPDFGWPSSQLYFHATDETWWYAEGRLSALERLKFGVTTGYTVIGATPPRMDDPIYAERQAQAVDEMGTRAVIGVGPPDPHVSHLPEPWSATQWQGDKARIIPFTFEDALVNSETVLREWHHHSNERIQVSLHYPYLFGRQAAHPRIPFEYHDGLVPEMIQRSSQIRELADRYQALIHSHIFAGSVAYGLEKFGREMTENLLRAPVAFAHANGLLPQEIELLGEMKTGICVVPYTHENLYYGVCPVIDLLKAGANVSIATDGTAPYCSYDLFKDISRAIWAQWDVHKDQKVLPPGKALRMVTIDAAKVLGMDHLIGSLEVGKRADLILIDFNQPHLTPAVLIPRLLTHYVTGKDVDTVLVDGKILMENRKVKTVNEQDVLDQAREAAHKSFERIDLNPYLAMGHQFWQGERYA